MQHNSSIVISIAQNVELLVRYGNCVRDARTHALIHQHCFRLMDFPRALVPQYGRGTASHTQASLANHSCSVRQIGQWTRAKKTGMASKLLRSVVKPVGMSRPVCGHLTMTAPIGLSWLLSLRHSISPACEDRLTQPRQQRQHLLHAWVLFHQQNVRSAACTRAKAVR